MIGFALQDRDHEVVPLMVRLCLQSLFCIFSMEDDQHYQPMLAAASLGHPCLVGPNKVRLSAFKRSNGISSDSTEAGRRDEGIPSGRAWKEPLGEEGMSALLMALTAIYLSEPERVYTNTELAELVVPANSAQAKRLSDMFWSLFYCKTGKKATDSSMPMIINGMSLRALVPKPALAQFMKMLNRADEPTELGILPDLREQVQARLASEWQCHSYDPLILLAGLKAEQERVIAETRPPLMETGEKVALDAPPSEPSAMANDCDRLEGTSNPEVNQSEGSGQAMGAESNGVTRHGSFLERKWPRRLSLILGIALLIYFMETIQTIVSQLFA